jgi:hypothetical protein
MNLKASFLPSPASIAVALFLGFGVSACFQHTVNSPVPPSITSATCEIPSDDSQAEPSSKIVASIYIDATESMQGFVQPGTTTRYARLLDGIVGGLREEWQQDEIYFAPFGEKVGEKKLLEQFSERYRQAKTVNFYQTREGFNFSQIEKAIEDSQAAPENLTIIVTDLYQKSGAIEDVFKVLKKNYLHSNNTPYSVGIVGHRSQFEGWVYDVGFAVNSSCKNSGQCFHYKTSDEAKGKYRPFYLIVLGTQSNVEHFFDSLKKNQKAKEADIDNTESNLKSTEWVIFSPKIVRSIAVLNKSNSEIIPPKSQDNQSKSDNNESNNNNPSNGRPIKSVSGINSTAGTIRVAPEYEQSVELFKITNLTSRQSSINNTVNYTPLPYTSISNFVVDPTIEVFNDYQKQFVVSNDSRLKKALKLESITPDANNEKLTFSTVIDSSAMNPGIYRFTVLLKADLGEAPWWQSWNGTEEIVSKKQGFKTYNLLPFLTSIQRGMSQLSDPTIGKFCYIIKKEN